MNTISDRQCRYNDRCLKKKHLEQRQDRRERFHAREQIRDTQSYTFKNEVKQEVKEEMETRKRSSSVSKQVRKSLRVMNRY
jgi:hypothetical protein